ncbi:MAG: hypothetical protein JO168_11265 [Solirubrobacterales bacterium]|nr:hypothetical protein [Solirubrobacterales bacterium]MBV9716948.1 hypothetical protein [Solirubrobacterales bacterium]
MELQGLRVKRAALLLALALALPAALGTVPAGARAATTTTAVDPNAPALVTAQDTPPRGYRLTAAQVLAIASRNPAVRRELRRHPAATPYQYTKGPGRWQVSWFAAGRPERELMQVYVDDASGRVTEVWTGFQVAWTMARGYPGAFGRVVNAWYVWVPLCIAFVAPFLPRRRRLSLLHLDLLVLLGFSISLALFNHAKIGLSVPLVYPCLIYLLVRMLLLAFGRGRPRRPLSPLVPTPWLVVGIVFLVGFRVGLNVTDSNVIDVGYAGVIGADKLLHGSDLYGNWPRDNASGDTYGPVNYYAYVPFRAIFGWSGSWDDLPAAHAAAIAFDLLTLLALFALGRRIRGPTLGVALAYAWAAYPFTLWTLSSNTNDSLVALLVTLTLLVLGAAPARGVGAALAGLSKLAPLALGPLFIRGAGERPGRRSAVLYLLAYAVTIAVAMLPVLLDHNLHAFWRDSIAYQSSRVTPFSVWGLWGGLGFEQHLLEGAAVALALAVAVIPRRRTVVEVSALAAAVVIALQICGNYWLYSYIVWFFPLVIVALFAAHPSTLGWAIAVAEDERVERLPLVPAGAAGPRWSDRSAPGSQ